MLFLFLQLAEWLIGFLIFYAMRRWDSLWRQTQAWLKTIPRALCFHVLTVIIDDLEFAVLVGFHQRLITWRFVWASEIFFTSVLNSWQKQHWNAGSSSFDYDGVRLLQACRVRWNDPNVKKLCKIHSKDEHIGSARKNNQKLRVR